MSESLNHLLSRQNRQERLELFALEKFLSNGGCKVEINAEDEHDRTRSSATGLCCLLTEIITQDLPEAEQGARNHGSVDSNTLEETNIQNWSPRPTRKKEYYTFRFSTRKYYLTQQRCNFKPEIREMRGHGIGLFSNRPLSGPDFESARQAFGVLLDSRSFGFSIEAGVTYNDRTEFCTDGQQNLRHWRCSEMGFEACNVLS